MCKVQAKRPPPVASVFYGRQELFQWYKDQARLHPDKLLQRLQDLRPTMLGKPNERCLSTKGAETGTLLSFCRDLALRHGKKLGEPGRNLLAMGNDLIAAKQIFASSQRVLTANALQALCDQARRAFALREAAGVPWQPKFHLYLHLCERARFHGNPQFYTTFADEGYNGRLSMLASQLHRLTFFRRVLANFRVSFSSRKKQKFTPGSASGAS